MHPARSALEAGLLRHGSTVRLKRLTYTDRNGSVGLLAAFLHVGAGLQSVRPAGDGLTGRPRRDETCWFRGFVAYGAGRSSHLKIRRPRCRRSRAPAAAVRRARTPDRFRATIVSAGGLDRNVQRELRRQRPVEHDAIARAHDQAGPAREVLQRGFAFEMQRQARRRRAQRAARRARSAIASAAPVRGLNSCSCHPSP